MAKQATRQKVVHVRLSEDEFLALQAFSIDAGLSVSEVLRRLSRHAGGFGPVLEGEASFATGIHINELNKVGDTLNRIARALNGRDEPGFEVLIDGIGRLARLVNDQAAELRSMCDRVQHRAREMVSDDV